MNKLRNMIVTTTVILASHFAIAALTDGQKIGDWQASCQTIEGKQLCGVIQVVNDNENKPIARIVLRKLPQANNDATMIITLPLGVNLQAGIAIAVDGKEIGRLPYAFCDQGGCNVAVPLQGEELNKIKAGNQLQVAAFVADKQQTVPFSLKGITSAINAL